MLGGLSVTFWTILFFAVWVVIFIIIFKRKDKKQKRFFTDINELLAKPPDEATGRKSRLSFRPKAGSRYVVKNGAKHAHPAYGDLIMLVSARNIWFVIFIMLIVVAALALGYLVAFGIIINPEGFNFSDIFDFAYFVIIGGGFLFAGLAFYIRRIGRKMYFYQYGLVVNLRDKAYACEYRGIASLHFHENVPAHLGESWKNRDIDKPSNIWLFYLHNENYFYIQEHDFKLFRKKLVYWKDNLAWV